MSTARCTGPRAACRPRAGRRHPAGHPRRESPAGPGAAAREVRVKARKPASDVVSSETHRARRVRVGEDVTPGRSRGSASASWSTCQGGGTDRAGGRLAARLPWGRARGALPAQGGRRLPGAVAAAASVPQALSLFSALTVEQTTALSQAQQSPLGPPPCVPMWLGPPRDQQLGCSVLAQERLQLLEPRPRETASSCCCGGRAASDLSSPPRPVSA